MTYKLNGSFETYRDPSGNPLISINRDGSINLVQIDFADGTTQSTAAGSISGAVVLAPSGDQTITGTHQFINKGTDQTGPLLSTFDSHITGAAFDPAAGSVSISGQSLGTGITNVGVQGIGQNSATSGLSESFGLYGLSSMTDTLGTGTGGPFGGFVQAFLTSTVNSALLGRGIGSQLTLSPAVGTTMSGLQTGQQSAVGNVGLGTVTTINAFLAEVDNIGDGAVTKGYGYNAASLISGATTTAVYHADDQGSGVNNYGILLDGVTNNYFGGGMTTVGSLIVGDMPTADPHVVGQLWNSSGTVHISAG